MMTVFCCSEAHEWTDIFKNSWTSVTDEEQSECPYTSTTEGNTEQIQMLIPDNIRVITDMANQLQISHCSAYEIICSSLHFHNTCARQVLQWLMQQHRHNYLGICNCFWRKVMPFCIILSLATKHKITTMGPKENTTVWNGNTWNPCQKEVQNFKQ